MRGSRAKRLRLLVAGLDMSDTPTYDSIEFKRKYKYLKMLPSGKTKEVKGEYPVRTIFLVKCKRAAYRRLKRLPKQQQDNLLKLVAGM